MVPVTPEFDDVSSVFRLKEVIRLTSRYFWRYSLSGSTYGSNPNVDIANRTSSPLMVLRFSCEHRSLASLVMKLTNSLTVSWTHSRASLAIFPDFGMARFIIRVMFAMGRNRSCSRSGHDGWEDTPSACSPAAPPPSESTEMNKFTDYRCGCANNECQVKIRIWVYMWQAQWQWQVLEELVTISKKYVPGLWQNPSWKLAFLAGTNSKFLPLARSNFGIPWPKLWDNVDACFSIILRTVHLYIILNTSLHLQTAP